MTLGGISDGISNWERGDSATCVALFLRRLASTFVDFRAIVFPFLFHRPFEPLKAPSRARSHPDRSSRGDPRAASVSLSLSPLSPLVEPVRRPFEASPRRMPIGRPYATGALHQALFLRATPPFSDSEHAPATRQRTGSDGEQTTQTPSTKHRFPAAIGLAAIVEKSARPTSRPRSRHERGWNKFSETSENRRVFQGFMLTPKGVPVARSTFRTASPKRLESEPNTTESLGISVLPQRSHPSREIVFFLISAPGSKPVGGCATGRLAMHFLRHLPSPGSARTLLGAPSSGAPSKPTDAVLSPFFVPCRECFFSSTRFDRYPFRKR